MSETTSQLHNQEQDSNNNRGPNGMITQWPEQLSSQMPLSPSLARSSYDGNRRIHGSFNLPDIILVTNQLRGEPTCPSIQQNCAQANIDGSMLNNYNMCDYNLTNEVENGNRIPNKMNRAYNCNNNSTVPVPNQSIARPSYNVTAKNPTVVQKPKRNRTAFTPTQLIVLEQEYKSNNFLDRACRATLSRTLDLHERTIKIWFQNRRMKDKKLKQCSGAGSTLEMPIVVQNDHTGELEYYVEQYSPASTSASPVKSQENQTPTATRSQPPYIPEDYDVDQQQINFQIQNYGTSTSYKTQIQETVKDPNALQDIALASPNDSIDIADENMDVSLLNSINMDEDDSNFKLTCNF